MVASRSWLIVLSLGLHPGPRTEARHRLRRRLAGARPLSSRRHRRPTRCAPRWARISAPWTSRTSGTTSDEFLIRLPLSAAGSESVNNNVTTALAEKFGRDKVEILRVEAVGPRVGQALREKAILAVVFATLMMGVYIWIRFEWRFGVGAAVALVHDVIISIGFLVALRLRVRPDHRRGAADHRRLLGERHGDRLRPHPREPRARIGARRWRRSSTAASTRR